MFIKPKLIKNLKLIILKTTKTLLRKVLIFFLKQLKEIKNFNIQLFKKSLESNYLMINFQQLFFNYF